MTAKEERRKIFDEIENLREYINETNDLERNVSTMRKEVDRHHLLFEKAERCIYNLDDKIKSLKYSFMTIYILSVAGLVYFLV